jgi:hypothetical protein
MSIQLRDDDQGGRLQIFINECRIYDGEDKVEAHKVLSLCERIVYMTKADGKIQIYRGNEESVREYFKGELLALPGSLVMQIEEKVDLKDKFGR